MEGMEPEDKKATGAAAQDASAQEAQAKSEEAGAADAAMADEAARPGGAAEEGAESSSAQRPADAAMQKAVSDLAAAADKLGNVSGKASGKGAAAAGSGDGAASSADAKAQGGAGEDLSKAMSDLKAAGEKLEKTARDVSVRAVPKKDKAADGKPGDKGRDDGDKCPLSRKEHPLLRAIYAGISLAAISAACCLIVLKADTATSAVIERNESASIARTVSKLLPKEAMDGAEFKCRLIDDPRVGRKMRLYTSEKDGEISGYVMTYSTNRGYAVPLVLIAGFTADKKVYKADILISHETPGLGDKVDRSHGDFLNMMNGKGLEASWDVRKFGGDFDYITGSTVTSRAVVTATGDALSALNEINVQDLKPCRKR